MVNERRRGVANLDFSRAVWRKSRRSNGGGGACVEVAAADRTVAVRDSKDRSGPVLAFDAERWGAFLDGVKHGRFDL